MSWIVVSYDNTRCCQFVEIRNEMSATCWYNFQLATICIAQVQRDINSNRNFMVRNLIRRKTKSKDRDGNRWRARRGHEERTCCWDRYGVRRHHRRRKAMDDEYDIGWDRQDAAGGSSAWADSPSTTSRSGLGTQSTVADASVAPSGGSMQPTARTPRSRASLTAADPLSAATATPQDVQSSSVPSTTTNPTTPAASQHNVASHDSTTDATPGSPDMQNSAVSSPAATGALSIPVSTVAVPFAIHVAEPQKQGEGAGAYATYLVHAKTTLPDYNTTAPAVRRRFQDFVWLQKRLMEEFPACIQPPLPGKHRMEYLTGDRFSPEFLEKRRLQLEIYLQRVARHPQLQQSPSLRKFLETEGAIISDVQQRNFDSRVLDNLSEAFLHVLSKVKNPDERFSEPRETIVKFEENLIAVEKLHSRLLKQNIDIQTNMGELSGAVVGLSSLEKDYIQQLSEFGSVLVNASQLLREHNANEDLDYVSNIREYIAYCQSVKELLRLREQKQIDMEELQNYLENSIKDHERTLSGRRTPGITGFLKEKYNDMRALDQEHQRREKLDKLTTKIDVLKEEVERSTQESAAFSNVVLSEIQQFNQNKVADFKTFLQDYTDTQLEYHQRGLKCWESVISAIEDNTFGMQQQVIPKQE